VETRLEYYTWLQGWFEGPFRHGIHASPTVPLNYIFATWVVCGLMIAGALIISRTIRRDPHGLQNLLEWLLEYVDKFIKDVVGPEGSQYTPFILTLFLFILFGSVMGIVPGFASPAANLNTTAALAIVAFLYVNYHAIRTVGLVNFLKGFFPPPIWMTWFLGPLEILSHLIRPLTLAVRLFGNIFGEDVLIAVLLGFGLTAFHSWSAPLPVQLPIMLFSLFTDLVQAAVFCMLTTVYIGLLTQHGHGADQESSGSHGPAHAAA